MRQVLLVIRRLVVAAMMMLMTAMYAAPGALAQHVETTTSAKDLQALAESIEDEGKRKELLATRRPVTSRSTLGIGRLSLNG